MKDLTVTIIGRDGCHLCDDATEVIERVLTDFPGVTLLHRSLDDEAELREQYSDKIPVVLVGNKEHAYWRVNPEKFRDTLLEAASQE